MTPLGDEPAAKTPVLVLAVGNSILTDDGAGPAALQLLQESWTPPPGIELQDGGIGGLDLLCAFEDAERVILVDAVRLDLEPGTRVRLEGDEIPETLGRAMSPHQVSLADVLSLMRLRGTSPETVVLHGVQVATTELGTELSPAVAAALPDLTAAVREEACRLLERVAPLSLPA